MADALEARNKHWYDHPAPGTAGSGCQTYYGVPASRPCQRLRCSANAVRVFAELYGVEARGGEGGLTMSIDVPRDDADMWPEHELVSKNP